MTDEPITAEDIKFAEQDLQDREDDFTEKYNTMAAARLDVLRASRDLQELKANFNAHEIPTHATEPQTEI